MQEAMDSFSAFVDITDNRDIVIQLSLDYTIERVNALAERVFGHASHELRGCNIFKLCGERGWPMPFFSEQANRQNVNLDEASSFHWRSFPCHDTNHRLVGFMIIGHQDAVMADLPFHNVYLDNIIAHVPYFIYWKDTKLRYQGCNDNFAKLLGLRSPEEIIGKTDKDFKNHPELRDYLGKDKRVLSGQAIIDQEIAIHLNAEHYYTIRASKVPLRDKQQQVIGVLGIHADISQHKHTEAALMAAKVTAEAANKAKTEFIANISHDLRTSLNVITGMSKLLHEREHFPEQGALIEGVIEAGTNLTHQIDEILDYSRIEAGKVALIQQSFNLQKLLEDVFDLHAFEAHSKGLCLLNGFGVNLPAQVVGDPVATKRIFGNLLSNALKFTDMGHVKLTVSCIQQTADSVCFEFMLSDTGIGIASDKLSTIFERFERLDPAYKGRYKGTGLGLSIVDWLVKRLGGEVRVSSEVGKGTTFTLLLSFGLSVSHQELPITEPVSGRILLIDDYQPRAQALLELLGRSGVICCKSNEAVPLFLQAIHAGKGFTSLLINDDLTELPLDQLIFALQQQQEFDQNQVAVLVRPHVHRSLEMKALLKDFKEIAKPIKPSLIRKQVVDLLKQIKQPKMTLQDEDAAAKILLVEDEPLAQKYCKMMLQERGYNLDVASTGKMAMELINQFRYQSILMDVGLPDANGIELTKIIRCGDSLNKNVPIIALTAHIDKSKQDECLDAGMRAFLNKPVSPNALCEVLNQFTTA